MMMRMYSRRFKVIARLTRMLLLSLCAVAAFGLSASAPVSVFLIVTTTPTQVCFVSETPLPIDEPVLVVLFDPQRFARGRISSVAQQPCSEENDSVGTAYSVSFSEPFSHDMEVGVAIVRRGVTVARKGDRIELRNVLRKRDLIELKRCASTEGLHLTAWRGASRVWHEYYYLGYDVEPDCSEAEVRD